MTICERKFYEEEFAKRVEELMKEIERETVDIREAYETSVADLDSSIQSLINNHNKNRKR